MNIFYEEGGKFKAAAVIQKSDATYQAQTQHGKRAKIKAANVFAEFDGDMADFLERAQEEATQIDTDLLWESCGGDEFTAEHAAAEYFGAGYGKVQLAATLMALYAAPAYFYKKSKGVFKAAPADVLQQALAAIERKKQQEAQIAAWSQELQEGSLPEGVAAELKQILYAPDKQSPAYKAFTQAADALKTDAYGLARRTGGIASLPQYLYEGFAFAHFPNGTAAPQIPLPPLPELPLAEGISAFSIDDDDTTEVDDALSLQDLGDGRRRVGIHIAAPTLALAAGSDIEKLVAARQSTVYYPGGKITMLPDNWIAAFSLDEGHIRPAFSIYFDIGADFQAAYAGSRIERVAIGCNLRIQAIEPLFNSETGTSAAEAAAGSFPHHADLAYLFTLAQELQKQRDRYEENTVKRYDYSVRLQEDGRVAVAKRERGSPIDTLVSEMMILANSTWAKMLDEHDLPAIFRVQAAGGRVRMSTRSEAHTGMNLSHYGWFTSPLRRAADCINQQQLASLLLPDTAPRYADNRDGLFAAVGAFESAHAAYREFQDIMEAYWSLVYLEQQQIREVRAQVLREDLVRVDGLPLVARATGIPLEIAPRSLIQAAVTALDAEKQHLALRYLNVVPAVDQAA